MAPFAESGSGALLTLSLTGRITTTAEAFDSCCENLPDLGRARPWADLSSFVMTGGRPSATPGRTGCEDLIPVLSWFTGGPEPASQASASPPTGLEARWLAVSLRPGCTDRTEPSELSPFSWVLPGSDLA